MQGIAVIFLGLVVRVGDAALYPLTRIYKYGGWGPSPWSPKISRNYSKTSKIFPAVYLPTRISEYTPGSEDLVNP